MGWSFSCVDIGRKAHIAELTSKAHFSEEYTPLEHRVVGNHVWQLVRQESIGLTFITLDIIAKERNGGWGYKGMSEQSGPYYYDCPLALLDKASEANTENAVEWRNKVRAHHAAKTQKKQAIAAGTVVQYGGRQYTLVRPAGPRKGWIADRVSDGCRFRMNARQLSQAAA